MNQYWSPLSWDKLFNVSILYIISEKRLLRSMSGRCVIGDSGNSKHTLVTALSLWYSAGVYRRHSVYVWVLGAVGDYIHPAAGCPRGEGGNVIYTLIMPAPPNTPPDRCNILDISTSFFPSNSHFPFHSHPSASILPCAVPSPMLIFTLLIMNTEQQRCRVQPWSRQRAHACVQNVPNRTPPLAPASRLSLQTPTTTPSKRILFFSCLYSFI